VTKKVTVTEGTCLDKLPLAKASLRLKGKKPVKKIDHRLRKNKRKVIVVEDNSIDRTEKIKQNIINFVINGKVLHRAPTYDKARGKAIYEAGVIGLKRVKKPL